jgi:hypothetical protein
MKYLKLFEQFGTEDKYNVLLSNGNFYYTIGSGDGKIPNPTIEDFEEILTQMIKHYFSNRDFIANNLYNEDLELFDSYFKENVIDVFLNNFDTFKEDYMGLIKPYPEAINFYWGIKKDFDTDNYFDSFMLESELPQHIIDKYIDYRRSYAGVDITE